MIIEKMIIEKMQISDFEKIKENLKLDFDDFWNANMLFQELSNEGRLYYVAKENDEIVGFCGIRPVLDEAEIMNIVVKKACRNQGIGKQLLEKIISYSKENNIKTLKLEVNETNIPAIKLYQSKGFELKGIRKNYYGTNSALLLDLKI